MVSKTMNLEFWIRERREVETREHRRRKRNREEEINGLHIIGLGL